MSEIERPERKFRRLEDIETPDDNMKQGYNVACNSWEAYHEQEIAKRDKSMMTVDEIGFIVFKTLSVSANMMARSEWDDNHYRSRGKDASIRIAKAIRDEMEKRRIK